MPASTSPVPPLASPTPPLALMAKRPSANATILPQPLSTTAARNRSANFNAVCKRSACTSVVVIFASRPASPGCGVIAVGALREVNASASKSSSAMRFSASASTTAGTSRRSAFRTKSRARSASPMPGPTTMADGVFSMTFSASRSMSSGCSMSTAGRALAARPSHTLPAPRSAPARAARIAAPTMPSLPPTIASVPNVPLWTLRRLRFSTSGNAVDSVAQSSR